MYGKPNEQQKKYEGGFFGCRLTSIERRTGFISPRYEYASKWSELQKEIHVAASVVLTSSVVDPHWFQCGSGYGSSIFCQCGSGSRVLMTKKLKNLQLKKNVHFLTKNCKLLISRPAKKGTSRYRRSFIPQKRTSGTSKLEFSSLLWVIFALLDQIRIPKADSDPADQIECGSGSTKLPVLTGKTFTQIRYLNKL
jgi:hypothetical protein